MSSPFFAYIVTSSIRALSMPSHALPHGLARALSEPTATARLYG